MLQAGRLPKDGKAVPFVSDFFDFSVYLDADEDVLLSWYVERFLDPARHRLRRPEVLFPPLRAIVRRGSDRHRDLDLEPHQPGQSAREHPADAARAPI